MLLPVQLAPWQTAALTNTRLNEYPGNPIMSGHVYLDVLVLMAACAAPLEFALDGQTLALLARMPGGRTVEEPCPVGRLGAQLWVQEWLTVTHVFADARAVRVRAKDNLQTRLIYLDESDREYQVGEELLTPKIEWARPERLLVREVGAVLLGRMSEETAARTGVPALQTCAGRVSHTKTHLRGYQLAYDDANTFGSFAGAKDRVAWLVGVERTFAE